MATTIEMTVGSLFLPRLRKLKAPVGKKRKVRKREGEERYTPLLVTRFTGSGSVRYHNQTAYSDQIMWEKSLSLSLSWCLAFLFFQRERAINQQKPFIQVREKTLFPIKKLIFKKKNNKKISLSQMFSKTIWTGVAAAADAAAEEEEPMNQRAANRRETRLVVNQVGHR